MDEKIAIHDTAFVTAAFRASDMALSKDSFAHLWPTAKTLEHMAKYTREVSEHEPIAHCLRNRFFYEQINNLQARGKIEVLINFGSGFSMYPFLLNKSLVNIEIDQAYIVDYKKEMTSSWQAKGKLPKRELYFLPCDFTNPTQLALLFSRIKEICGNRPSFILLEGVLFFLGGKETAALFDLFAKLQQAGDYIGSVSFKGSLARTRVFERLINFVEGNLEKNETFNYQTLEDRYYKSLPFYTLEEHTDSLKLANIFLPDTAVNAADILNEHMYILERNQNPYNNGY